MLCLMVKLWAWADQSRGSQRHQDFAAQASVTLLINSVFLCCPLWSFSLKELTAKSGPFQTVIDYPVYPEM